MAVTVQYSPQYQAAAQVNSSGARARVDDNDAKDAGGKLRVAYFKHTQSGAGDATSQAYLCKLPAGTVRVIPALSYVRCSAFGAARTVDIGYGAYTDKNGATVATDPDAFADGLDVSSAAKKVLDETAALAAVSAELESNSGIDVVAVVAGGTIPDAATLEGHIVYATE